MNAKFWLVWPIIFIAFSLSVVSLVQADNFERLGAISSSHGVDFYAMALGTTYIAVADGGEERNGVEVIDVSNPAQMLSVGYSPTGCMAYFLKWEGQYIYMPSGNEGLLIYEFSETNGLILASHTTFDNQPVSGIAVKNSIAYVGADNSGISGALYCLAIFDPFRPGLLWSSDTLNCFDIVMGQNLMYTFSWCQDLKIIDVSNPTHPVQITRVPCTYVNAIDVDELRNLMYVTCFDYGLNIYDISNPLAPQFLSAIQMPGRPQCFKVCHSDINRHIVFVLGFGDVLWAVDTSDPWHPAMATAFYPNSGQPSYIVSRGNLVLLTTIDSLIALRYDCETASDDAGDIPSDFSLMQNYPNPFNNGTSISYVLLECTNIRLEIYDALGRKIETLYEGLQAEGNAAFQWDASEYSSGSYFYGLTVDGRTEYRKMTLIK